MTINRPFKRHNSMMTRALIISCIFMIASLLTGCPEQTTQEEEEPEKPTLLLSSYPVCTEMILPKHDLEQSEVEPIFLPLDVKISGVNGSEAAALKTVISFEPERPAACLQSSVTDESGEITNLRCRSNRSAELQFSRSRRVSDAFYCTGTGRFLVKAKTTLNDEERTVIESNALEISCLPADVFDEACESTAEPEPDMALPDMDPVDMDFTDMGEPSVAPASWAVIFDPEQSAITNLSVQGSSSEYPKNASYIFSVVDEQGRPIPDVPVTFYLDWSAGAGDQYPACLSPCAEVSDASACEAHPVCQWVEEQDTSADMDVEDESEGGTDEALDMGMEPADGSCVVPPDYSGDQRCAVENARCESNYCLPENISGLPLAIEPLNAVTDFSGQVTVGIVTSRDPGIYSVRAVARFNNNVQMAHTPNLTVWHQIPSQDNISFRCKSPVVAGFFRRYTPNEIGGTDPLGYLGYQRPATECDFQTADRFTGRIAGVPVFFMSESGTITQSVPSNEEGMSTAMWYIGGQSPVDVNPIPGEVVPDDPDAVEGHNMRDGLVRLIGFTQGEARFIDYHAAENMSTPALSGDGIYSPGRDIVPPHPEPYLDNNDNGQWDAGEPYHDANRNQVWDADVFGRSSAQISKLKCFEIWFKERLANPSAASMVSTSFVCEALGSMDNEVEFTQLTMNNPADLQTTIWTSTTALSVGMPQEQEKELTAECRGAACSFTPVCDDATPGLDLYLAPSGAVDIRFAPRDDNHNCVGLDNVEINVNLAGQSNDLTPIAPFFSMNDINSEFILIGTTRSVMPEECYDTLEPMIPTAHDYKFALLHSPSPDAPAFSIAQAEVTLKVPSYRVGDASMVTRTKIITIGLCNQ